MAPILYKGTNLATSFIGNERGFAGIPPTYVNTGLIVDFDFGNPLCYTSGSTTVNNLASLYSTSFKNISGSVVGPSTLQNGVEYLTDNNGVLVFEGGQYTSSGTGLFDNIVVQDSDGFNFTSDDPYNLGWVRPGITVEMWINPQLQRQAGFNRANTLFSKRGAVDNGFIGLFTGGLNTTPAQITFRAGTSAAGGTAIWNSLMVTGSWQQIAFACGDSGSASPGTSIYKNGEAQVNVSYAGKFTGTPSINTSANLLIGDINPASTGIFAYKGEYGMFRVYGRKLNSDEIKQNFDVFRRRYGI
jgi:hypothetical protein